MPSRTFSEIIAYAKANLGKLSFGSSGVAGSPRLAVELLKMLTDINIVHLPYQHWQTL